MYSLFSDDEGARIGRYRQRVEPWSFAVNIREDNIYVSHRFFPQAFMLYKLEPLDNEPKIDWETYQKTHTFSGCFEIEMQFIWWR